MPWHIPEDFKYFKAKTTGKPVIMGRSTYESIHGERGTAGQGPALPNRKNIIITRQSDYVAKDCSVCSSVEEAIAEAKLEEPDEIMIIGGGQIYTMGLDYAERIYLTEIELEYPGDVYFPDFDEDKWSLASSDPQDGYSFNIYERK